jgi:hypothetical protein
MRKRFLFAAVLGLALLTVGTSATMAASRNGNTLFLFNGRLLADAGNSPTIAVDVKGGNKLALKKLIGQSDDVNFTVDPSTQFLRWTHGVPTVVPESNLLAGDRVTVRVRADRRSSLAQIATTAARQVADQGPSGRFPSQPLWLFIGKLNGPASGGHVSLHITDGNLLALRGMLGQPLNESFSYDAHTVFVLWQGRVPTVISPGQLKAGDRISVRVRAPRSFSVGQVTQVAANHIGDHEPG